MIPLYHDFTDQTVLIFGGGPVGARKARRFAAEARVVVVSPAFEADDFGGADLIRARPAADDVGRWFDRTTPALAVAATDDDGVNDAVAAAARDRGVLLNRADRSAAIGDGGDDAEDPDAAGPPADVVVPATVTDGDVRVAISTGGRSPALAKYLRERIGSEIEGAEGMADLTADLRAELRASDLEPSERRDAVRAVVRSSEVWKGLRTGTPNPRREATRVIRNTTGGDRWTRK
ncbi:precorrin-2 dehydrogenase/sirohydrochlorin ferrochelatase family protein [Halobellus ruber]|uniref:precorrin-2 dehydrogenase n=1 Tax=Halobellus ruber TaxID=2761102 RepID=A0A7J9SDD4_9EURY|nr:bifunctional precorrin-2 dehydrogenase/sirohydrochlorin ferrochelatase [Halobellus ruber]MBB6644934.1 bifunctional precorrin-2 dehydrogenase/sirohydrochlorin ferrochelatase [Halobellus ruber]